MLISRTLRPSWTRLLRKLRYTCRPAVAAYRPRVEELERRDVPSLMGNQLFPADNPWNQKIAGAPVAGNSATLVNSIGANSAFHPDFGTIYNGAYIGIPINIVPGTHPKLQVMVDDWPDESDQIPVPIPAGALLEGDPLPSSQNDGDRHLIVYDKDNNVAYEMFNVHRPSEEPDGKWHASNISFWDMKTNYFRTPGDTSADAAGLPILPGLVRPDEVFDQGIITHALRFTVPATDDSWIFPASHQAGVNNPNLPRMGERFRLKASFDISGFSPANQVILQALKDYGLIVADNGSGWYVQGQPSTRWNDAELSQLKSLRGSNFEAVDLTPRATSATSPKGSVTQGTVVTINGSNFGGGAGLTKVFFGTLLATSVTVVSDTLIRAVAPAVPSGPVSVKVQSPYGTSNSVIVGSFTPPKLTTLTAGDGQVFGLDAQNTLWRYQPGNNSWISAGTTAVKFVVANLGDGLSSTDLVYFLTSDNRLGVWNQQSVTFTGGWLANIWAGDNQIFGIGTDGQVWRDNAVTGWAAGHAWGAEIAVANTRDRNSANDVVFLRGADNSIWVWHQQSWINTRGWLPNIVAGDNQV